MVSDARLLTSADLGLDEAEERLPTLREKRDEVEREALHLAMVRAGGNRSRAARILGISRTQLYEPLRRHPDAGDDLEG